MSIFSKIIEVFTKEYREETEYREFLEDNVDKAKLKGSNFNVDASVENLKYINFRNNFHLSVEEINQKQNKQIKQTKREIEDIER